MWIIYHFIYFIIRACVHLQYLIVVARRLHCVILVNVFPVNGLSGIFTAPTDGRYLVTAVLAAQRGERVEAVLSVSNRSIQRLDSAGFLSGAETLTSHDQCNCASSTSLSLVLSLSRGDRAGLVMTAGKLAISASSEILSSFSAVLLYPETSKR